MPFLHVNAAATDTWPTGDNSSRTASRSTTAGGSDQTAQGYTRIHSVQLGPSSSAGTLTIQAFDGSTLIREVVLDTAGNIGAWISPPLKIDFPGGFSANVTSGGGVDCYIDYEYSPSMLDS